MRRPGRRSALLPGLGEADQERSSLALRMAGAAADPERSFRATVIRGDMSRLSRSWNGSLVPRLQFVITAGAANASLTCRYARAAYRNRTDDLRITRGTRPDRTRAGCTDGTEMALTALAALGLSKDPFHEPFHARARASRRPCSLCVMSLGHSHQDSQHAVDARPVMPTADSPFAAGHANSGLHCVTSSLLPVDD